MIFLSDTTVCVSIFDSLALAFHSKFDVYGREPRIVVVTAVNPKLVSGKLASCHAVDYYFYFFFVVKSLYKVPCVLAGKLYLNGTSATRIFFDSETAVGADAFARQASFLLFDNAIFFFLLLICHKRLHFIILAGCQVVVQTSQGLHPRWFMNRRLNP